MKRERALCDNCATDMVEAIAAKSRNWTRDSALLSYIDVDLAPVACEVCGAEGCTYSEPCWDELSFIGAQVASRFSPTDQRLIGAA